MTRLLFQLIVLLTLMYHTSFAQEADLPEELGTAQGVYKIHLSLEEIPKIFRDIDYINLRKVPGTDTANPPTDKLGRVVITGEIKLKGGQTYRFKEAHFQKAANGDYKGIVFTTSSMLGVWYTFSGEFLEERIYDESRGNYTRMKGTLVRHSRGKNLASYEFPFFEYAEL